MTINKLASEIAKREGKKSQARIGDIREIIGVLSDILYEQYVCDMDENADQIAVLLLSGEKRAKKKR